MYKKCAQRVENLPENSVVNFPQSTQLAVSSRPSTKSIHTFHYFGGVLPRLISQVLHKRTTQLNRSELVVIRIFHQPYYYYY